MSSREQVIAHLKANRRAAHQFLFEHRHPETTPDFHYEMIDDWHGPSRAVMHMAYRGSAKSTIGEEAVVIRALFKEFHNCVILGESQPKANERLAAIKYEFEENEVLNEIFGDLVGTTWNEDKIILTNGVCIQSKGAGQSFRGTKHLIWRPDLLFVDDLENDENSGTPDARAKLLKYFMANVRGALAKNHRMMMTATPLGPEALAVKFYANPDWHRRRYPVKYRDVETGEWRSTWPDQRSIEEIDALEQEFRNAGSGTEFMQEYMVEAQDPASKAFTPDMFRTEATVRAYQPVVSVYDPARTAKEKSAHTGVVHGSWSGNRLLVWEAYGRTWMPDQIIDDMFRQQERFNSATVGVEDHGLHEFLMQPLRAEQVRRQQLLPLKIVKPPKGKDDFIRSLQPFFKAGEVIFAGECADLRQQLEDFPTGRKDVPNALAYFLTLRPGQLVYDGLGPQHIVEDMVAARGSPVWVTVNSRNGMTAAVLMQLVNGSLHILADYVREGDAGIVLADILQDATLEAAMKPRLMAAPAHFEKFETVGLRAAARKIPVEVRQGGPEHVGREEVRALLRRAAHGQSALMVSTRARWVLNGFLSGYAYGVEKTGALSSEPVEGNYRVLMECIETFTALLRNPVLDDTDSAINYAQTADGRRYISARAR
jgi:hypothetical protein